MKKGKAVRVYSVNKEKLKEALDAIDELVKPMRKELLDWQRIHTEDKLRRGNETEIV